ncbi:hypothetical protein AJ79_00686 [Helicocarpus griseus UAMH5409]|uniref:RTA1 domain-containing protein n=1 Tax=Helicocarpus griseus UAMH5409 TaxID=1447875 RepID=A0A2B7YAD5_9EURO|nr:hypothetical protein AJ79_00686 [Helicocarpus griseus UAMH5409]
MSRCNLDLDDDETGWVYCPSVEAAILFTALFGLTSLVHMFQWYTFRKKFSWVIVMSCLWETAGFAFRIVSAQRIRGLWHFIPQQLFIILAPVWLNAFVYMVMGRMIYFFIPEKKIFGVSAKRITLVFVLLDILSMLVQAASSSLMTSDDARVADIGLKVYMGGIGLQELFILIFLILAARFQHKMTRLEQTLLQPTSSTHNHYNLLPWRRLLYALYAGLILITIRIIFRMVEYSSGHDTGLATSEAAFYCLEALPMIVGLGLFNFVHPGMVLVGPESEFPKKEKKEKKKKGKKGKEGGVKERPKRPWRLRNRPVNNDVESASELETEDAMRSM